VLVEKFIAVKRLGEFVEAEAVTLYGVDKCIREL
jgi:hypothetical protein